MAMYIKVSDYNLLNTIYERIWRDYLLTPEEIEAFLKLIERLNSQRVSGNERSRLYIAERRKVDKNYARPKR